MLELIYDRTEEDVRSGTAKGFYRHTDLNRVQTAMFFVWAKLASMGYDNVPAPGFGTFSENDIPRFSRMDAYIRAVRSLDGMIPLTEAPDLPTSPDRLDYIGANAIEKFLTMLDDSADRIAGAWFYCDEVYGGEVDA